MFLSTKKSEKKKLNANDVRRTRGLTASSIKLREISMVVILATYFSIKFMNTSFFANILYISISSLLKYDADIAYSQNYHGELEDVIFQHNFINLADNIAEADVNVTYHYVECGPKTGEPVVFYHGMLETWKAWKSVMKSLCEVPDPSYRVIAVDIEGQGQSSWHSHGNNIKLYHSTRRDIRELQSMMQLLLLRSLKVDKFNLVVSDYGFWTTFHMLSLAPDQILRYGKIQSVVGVPENEAISDINIITALKSILQFIYNSSPRAYARVVSGKQKISFPGVVQSRRVGKAGISDDLFYTTMLPEIQKNVFTGWIDSFYYGSDMVSHMTHQIQMFSNLTCPVLLLHGDSDYTQPKSLFDGSMVMELFPVSGQNFIGEYLYFHQRNKSHEIYVQPSSTNATVKRKRKSRKAPPPPKAANEYFPQSSWIKLKYLEGVGHFPLYESPTEISSMIHELLRVPAQSQRVDS